MSSLHQLEERLKRFILKDEPNAFAEIVRAEMRLWSPDEIHNFFGVHDEWQQRPHSVGYRLFMHESLYFTNQGIWDEIIEDVMLGVVP